MVAGLLLTLLALPFEVFLGAFLPIAFFTRALGLATDFAEASMDGRRRALWSFFEALMDVWAALGFAFGGGVCRASSVFPGLDFLEDAGDELAPARM